VPTGTGNTYEIVNVNSNMCLTTDGVAGDQVYQEPCTDSPDQLWDTNMGSTANYTTMQSDYSYLYLDVNGDSPWPGGLDRHLVLHPRGQPVLRPHLSRPSPPGQPWARPHRPSADAPTAFRRKMAQSSPAGPGLA
jgi:Ricin-type beta-trefoil lectin domain-like